MVDNYDRSLGLQIWSRWPSGLDVETSLEDRA